MVIPVLIWLCTGDEMDTKKTVEQIVKLDWNCPTTEKWKQKLMQRYRRQFSLIFAAVSTLKNSEAC